MFVLVFNCKFISLSLTYSDILSIMLSANLTSLKVKMPKKKVMSTVASRWRQFKSHLTSKFVFADNEGQASSEPTVKYGIYPAIWAEFAKSRQTPNWQVCQI